VRRLSIAAVLVTLAWGLPVRSQSLQPFATLAGPADAPVEIEADSMTYAYDAKVLKLEGHVVARRAGGIVRAQSGLFDREHGKLSLSGGVLGVQGRQVFLADEAFVDLNAKTAEFHGGKQETATTTETVQEIQGSKLKKIIVTTTTTTEMAVLYLKEKAANPDAPKSGKNTLILHGSTVQQKEKGIYVAQHVVITPCDCVGEPDYVLQADEAVLDGDRAHLSGTKLHFPHVTVPIFPLSLPLTNRQWGLLAPSLGASPTGGFGFALPVFVPLGDSYDLTLSPGYFTGGTGKNPAAPAAVGSRDIKGPRLGLELRYAPAPGTTGSVNFDMFYDQAQHQLPHSVDPPPGGDGPAGSGRGIDGVRGVARIAHRSEGDAGIFAVQGTIATDVMVVQDAELASLDRYVDFLRTDLGAWRARGATTVGIDATLLQDVRIPDATEPDRRLFGAERRATFQRLPGLFAQVADNPVGPLTFGLETSAVAFAPFGGPDAHERATGFSPTDFGAGLAPPLPGAGSAARSQALRGDFAPRLSWSGPESLPVTLRFDAGGRADGYLELGYPERDHTRAYADLGATIGLPLERRFGSLLHRIEPMLELRGITPSLQSGGPPIGDPADAGGVNYSSAISNAQQNLQPGLQVSRIGACTIVSGTVQAATCGVPSARRAYDELDGAAPSTGAVEAVASLDQTLWTKSGHNAVRAVRLNLQQDVLFGSGGGGSRLGEGSATVSVQNQFASATTTFRYDWQLGALSTIIASGGLHDARTDEVHAGTTLLRGASSERLRAGIDELFSAATLNAVAGPLSGSWNAGGSAPLLWNLRLAYEYSKLIDTAENRIQANVPNLFHTATISYDTPCHCAAMSLAVALPFHDTKLIGGPSIRFLLDLKSLGSFATF
jgi:LPS-assembly protein